MIKQQFKVSLIVVISMVILSFIVILISSKLSPEILEWSIEAVSLILILMIFSLLSGFLIAILIR